MVLARAGADAVRPRAQLRRLRQLRRVHRARDRRARHLGSVGRARRRGRRALSDPRGARAAGRMRVCQPRSAVQPGDRSAAGGHGDHRQHRARPRADDCGDRRALPAAGGKHGRRRVHVRLPDASRPVRAGARGVEPGPAAQSRVVENGRRRPQPERVRAAHHRSGMTLTLGFSPCPNDCFMFDAIVNRRIDLEGLEFSVRMADVEALNQAAFAGQIDVTKLSYHAFAYCTGNYVALDAGSALGRNCGPLLISKRPISPDEVAAGTLRIAIPGKYTTANFLLGFAFPAARNTTELVFSDLEAAVLDGRFDAGLIIHENRFTYQDKGLRKIVDLGEYWESKTGAPIPLGGIVIRRTFPQTLKEKVNRVLRRSVEYAFAHRDASLPFVREHAQEMSEAVMYQHIDLYVNHYSIDLGAEGRRAIDMLFSRAAETGLIPAITEPLFLPRVAADLASVPTPHA